ncbi:MAG: hypothetical protein RL411_1050 [Bacteroidota bacterium]|jgi:hypothetical protein
MRHFKAAVSFLFIILLSGNTANAQFGTYHSPREIRLFDNNAPTEYQSRRFAYFENGFFEAQTYRIEGDSNLHSQYVFNGKLSPRLIDDSYFKNLIQNEPTCDRQFICDEKWQFNVVQVRHLQGKWNGFKNIRTGEISNENANQFGGFLICAKDSGIFVSPGSGIYYIPYTYIKNIRRGISFGEFVLNQTARRRRTIFSRPSYDMSEILIWIPIAAIIYNVSGLFPNKVARFNGDPRGKEFAMNIGKIGAYENSSHATTDFPLALLNIKRNIFSSVHRSLLPPQNVDSLELIADQVQLKVVPHYQDYQLKIRNYQTEISLAPENAAITPSLPHLNEFNNSQGEMPILWAIEQFQPLDVSPKLFKTFPKTQKELLTSGQIEQLTKSADIQMLAIHILTGNGLDFSRLFQFTDEQAIKLNRTITIDAVEAQLGTMLRVIDIPTIEYKNLTMLYQRLNQIMKK